MTNHEEEENPEEKKPKVNERIDLKLLEARRLFISDAVTNETASELIQKLWYLEMTAPGKPILFVINSPGGSVDAGFAIWDQIKMISSPVTTLVTGLAASMGSVLGLCAAPKRRFATPRARFMIHQPALSGVVKGQASDLEIQAKQILKTHKEIIELYMAATGKDYATIERAIDRDTWMDAEEAKAFGLIDRIIHTFKDI